jgi:hypothetical protein
VTRECPSGYWQYRLQLSVIEILWFSSPESASISSFKVIEGDFIIVATDGLWDNMPDNVFITEISKIKVWNFGNISNYAKKNSKSNDNWTGNLPKESFIFAS